MHVIKQSRGVARAQSGRLRPLPPPAMKRGLAVALALLALLAAVSCRPGTYSDRFDHIDIEEIFGNVRLYKNYLQCLLADSDARCTADAKELKRVVPEALSNGCEKCTEKEKANIRKVYRILKDDHADDWAQLRIKWDPDNVYSEKFKEWLAQ